MPIPSGQNAQVAPTRRRAALLAAAAVAAVGLGIGLGLSGAVTGGTPLHGHGTSRHQTAGGPSTAKHHGPSSTTVPPTGGSGASGAAGAGAPSTGASGGRPHLMLIMLENHGYGQIVGSVTAPYLNHLIARYGLATASYADTHPSLPNYIDIASGTTQGITSDCANCSADATQLVDQLQRAGIGWGAYLEAMPGPCYTGTGPPPYDKNHNPFAHAPHLVRDASECAHVVPYSQLGPQLANGTAPPFIWVTPDVTHDMHTGSVAEGDTWLSQQLPIVLRSRWYADGGVIVLTFDEGVTDAGCCGGAAGGHIATIVVSASTPSGARLATPVDTAGVLRTIEELYHLPFLGAAADPASGTLLPLLGRAPGGR